MRDFYNIKRSISQHGIWSFITCSKVFHVSTLCAMVGFLGLVCTCAMPKVLHGDLMRIITFHHTRVKTHSSWEMMKFNYLLDQYPDHRFLVLQKDGCTIDGLLLDKQMKARDVEFPLTGLEHSHCINFWPFSHKSK